MFILTKNKIEESQVTEIEKNIISKKELRLKDALIIKQPNHLKLIENFDITQYQYLYETDDYIIHENKSLLEYLKTLDFEGILKVLINTHKDNIASEDIVSYIINNNSLNTKLLSDIESMIQELSQKIYFKNRFNPNIVIKQLRYELKIKDNLSNLEKIKYEILKDRTTRWMLLKIKRQITQLKSFFLTKLEFTQLSELLKDNKYYLYISSEEHSTVYDKNGKKTINSLDLFTNYRYRDLKDLKDSSAVNYKKLKYIYIASNKYILKKVEYKDFLKDTDSVNALYNLLKTFKTNNLNKEYFNTGFLEEVIKTNNEKLKDVIFKNFTDLIDENLLDYFRPQQSTTNPKNIDNVLSFISDIYEI